MKTINTKLRPLALAGGFLALMYSVGAHASSIPGLTNTGVTAAQGQIENVYVLDDQTLDNLYDNKGKVAFDGKWAVASEGPWLANTTTSRWLTAAIVPASATTTGHGALPNETASVAPGTYKWTYTFDLTGFKPLTASLKGRFSADNSATVSLNGGPTIGTALGFTQWYDFATSNLSTFLPGLNTLTFLVTNAPGTSGNPTGLRVEFTNSSVSAVPLPPAALLFGSVLLGAGAFGRKKLFNKSDSQAIAA